MTRVTGQSFYRTAVDITNNTATDGVIASFQYCFTLSGVYQGCTTSAAITLHPYDNFHTDDIIDYLGQQSLISADAADASFGTFIVTFDGLPSNNGWEGTVLGRTYNAANNADPVDGDRRDRVSGISLLRVLASARSSRSCATPLRATRPPARCGPIWASPTPPSTTSSTRSTFQVSFFDTATGVQVGGVSTPPHALAPGEVFQFNDVFTAAAAFRAPSNSCIAFIDITSTQSPTTPFTIEGYVDVLDGGTNDGAYYEFKCSVGCANF